jgi:DNA-directed RNA polymerase I, II, and III subunit RPABC2
MTSYFDEDILSDNDFDNQSSDDSSVEEQVENKNFKNKINKSKINVDVDEDLDDEENQYGGADDFLNEEEGGIEEDVDADLDQDQDPEDLEEEQEQEQEQLVKKPQIKIIPDKMDMDLEDEELDDEDGESYLKKFDKEINKNYIMNFHPECITHNYDEVEALTKVVRDKNNNIIDDLHRTIPYLTKYERTRIIGQRAKQINAGGTAFVKVPENVIDGYLIAELELKEKRIPFIIRRPLPNGGSEYWNVRDLENIAF